MRIARGLTFSPSRFFGVTALRRRIARASGVPTSRTDRRSKLGRLLGMK